MYTIYFFKPYFFFYSDLLLSDVFHNMGKLYALVFQRVLSTFIFK